MTCTATHAFTQAELDASGSPVANSGVLANTVTASSNEAAEATDSLTIPIARGAELRVQKSSSTTNLSAPGPVSYSYLVTNTGNVTLTGIGLADNNIDATVGCPKTSLAPSESMTCTAAHIFTQAELDRNGSPTAGTGVLANTVTASSNEANATDSLEIPITRSPELTVVKSSSTLGLSTPKLVAYSYLVTNEGNVTLTGIALADNNVDGTVSCPKASLAPAESMTCTATHTFTQAQLDANGSPVAGSGVLANTVLAASNEAPTAKGSLKIPITQGPELSVVKSSPTTARSAPGLVAYSYLVTNTGNVTVTGIALTDDNVDGTVSCPKTSLAPTEQMTCSASHTFTQA